jgi:hypothetical protein
VSDGGGNPPIPVGCGSTPCTSSKRFCCTTRAPLDAAAVDAGGPGPGGPIYACVAALASCTSEVAVTECASGKNCGSGQVCCRLLSGGVTSQLCELSCPTGEVQLCASSSECISGQRCRIPAAAGDAAPPATGTCVTPADSGSDGGSDATASGDARDAGLDGHRD